MYTLVYSTSNCTEYTTPSRNPVNHFSSRLRPLTPTRTGDGKDILTSNLAPNDRSAVKFERFSHAATSYWIFSLLGS